MLELGDTSKINNSAAQLFSRELKQADAFNGGFAAARMPGERGEPNFALLHARYVLVPSYRESLNKKLVFWCVQLRRLHEALARVKALDAGATLMQVYVAVTATRGRPLAVDGAPLVAQKHEKIETYSSGAFKPAWLVKQVNFDARSVGNSLRRSKGDALQAAQLLFTNVPDAAELSGRVQKGKSFHYPARRTSSGHAKDVALWRTEQAAAALGPVRSIFWDEGTRSDGTSVLIMGGSGRLPDGAINRRMCGLIMPLDNKEGASIAAAVLSCCAKSQIARSYMPLSDSVSSTVGYKTGAIAHLRQRWRTPLIIVLKCTAHKVARALRKLLQSAGGGISDRPAVKRQQTGKVQLNRTTLMLEDVLFLLKKCPALQQAVARQQRERLHKIDGHVDARWEWDISALEEVVGLTVVMKRLEQLYKSATPAESAAPTLASFKEAVERDPWQQLDWWERLFNVITYSKKIKGGKGGKKTLKLIDPSRQITIDVMFTGYSGPRVMPVLDVVASALDPQALNTISS